MEDNRLLVRRSDGVASVTLNRPERLNALDGPLREALVRHLDALALDGSVRCVVIRGSGASFCAGGDVRAAAPADAAAYASGEVERALRQHAGVVETIYTMPKPVIALLRGHVIGGGLSIALACDVRIGTATTQCRVGHLSAGLSGDYGITYLLPETVGGARAREMALLDRTVGAEEALATRLLNELVADETLEARGSELASRLASLPSLAVAKLKENLAFAARHGLRDTIYIECANLRIVNSGRPAHHGAGALAP